MEENNPLKMLFEQKLRERTAILEAQTEEHKAAGKRAEANLKLSEAQLKQAEANTKLSEAQLEEAKTAAQVARKHEKQNQELDNQMPALEQYAAELYGLLNH